jgi:metallo-beta-lactamase family protein
MRLSFHGAAGEVTGSCYLLETGRHRILIDAGAFQGGAGAELKNRRHPSFDPAQLDAIIVTHGHLDHVGRLPMFTRDGFKGRVYTTLPTIPLCDISLRDAAHLMNDDWERRKRKKQEINCPPGTYCGPLFDENDVTEMLRRCVGVAYDQPREILPGVTVTFVDAGHILGSASVIIKLASSNGDPAKTIVFSGDVGEYNTALLRDPTLLTGADIVVLESTYGDRDHQPLRPTIDELHRVALLAQADGGKVLIPAFAIGRTQTLLYHLAPLACSGQLKIPVIVDSPMGIAVTKLYERNQGLFDEESKQMFATCDPFHFPGLRMSVTGQESRAINDLKGPAIILAGAGMCNGGRIVHHLAQHLPKANTHVVIAGFQAEGTLGRRLVNREKQVKIFGQWVDVKAQIHTLGGFSAHGGRTTLIGWAGSLMSGQRKPRVFLTHGEEKPRQALRDAIYEKFGVRCQCPQLYDSVELGAL